jgi:hypothetical protein
MSGLKEEMVMKRPRRITVDNLADATEQEVANHIGFHLLSQNKRAKSAAGKCCYRTPSGLRCAAGCLFTKKQYEELDIREGSAWPTLIDHLGITNAHYYLIRDMQNLHDFWAPTDWKHSLLYIFKERGLDTAVLNQF